jgi:hypothetical protein
VYVQEVPVKKRPITGVSTATTAFLGRTTEGPTNTPTVVRSFAEFATTFGGLRADSPMTYAVQDFFQNGGATAVLIRLFEGDAATSTATVRMDPSSPHAESETAAAAATSKLEEAKTAVVEAQSAHAAAKKAEEGLSGAALRSARGKSSATSRDLNSVRTLVTEYEGILSRAKGVFRLNLVASSAGAWGNKVTYVVDTNGINEAVQDRFATDSWDAADLFNITLIRSKPRGRSTREQYANVSMHPSAGTRSLRHILETQSSLARLNNSTTNNVGEDSESLSTDTYAGGLQQLSRVNMFNILCIPPDEREGDTEAAVYSMALTMCSKRRAMLVVDPPNSWHDDVDSITAARFVSDLGISSASEAARHAVVYFPRIVRPDPLHGGYPMTSPACGAVAGIYARTDSSSGVWQAPAGLAAGIVGATDLSYTLTDAESGSLNSQGINGIRSFVGTGPVLWGTRTMRGADQLADEFKYLPIRRLADYMEEYLLRNTKFAVFQNNNQALWTALTSTVEGFMRSLAARGAFAGGNYFVRCDSSTTNQDDIDKGVVNMVIGYAPLKPAEFVILYLQQSAGGGE